MADKTPSDQTSLANSVAGTIRGYTWLFSDVLIFLVVSVSLYFYKDFDESMRHFTKVAIVLLFGNLWISSLQILMFMRNIGTDGKLAMLPWYKAYLFPLMKLVLLCAVIWWLYCKNLI